MIRELIFHKSPARPHSHSMTAPGTGEKGPGRPGGLSQAVQGKVAEVGFEPRPREHPALSFWRRPLASVRPAGLPLGSEQAGILTSWEINLAS